MISIAVNAWQHHSFPNRQGFTAIDVNLRNAPFWSPRGETDEPNDDTTIANYLKHTI